MLLINILTRRPVLNATRYCVALELHKTIHIKWSDRSWKVSCCCTTTSVGCDLVLFCCEILKHTPYFWPPTSWFQLFELSKNPLGDFYFKTDEVQQAFFVPKPWYCFIIWRLKCIRVPMEQMFWKPWCLLHYFLNHLRTTSFPWVAIFHQFRDYPEHIYY